jgi:hypothetical protein
MTKNILKTFVLLFFLAITLLWRSQVYPAQSGDGPIIHVRQTSHIFPTVFEGEKLSHTFTVFNQGTANLDIKRVTSS